MMTSQLQFCFLDILIQTHFKVGQVRYWLLAISKLPPMSSVGDQFGDVDREHEWASLSSLTGYLSLKRQVPLSKDTIQLLLVFYS